MSALLIANGIRQYQVAPAGPADSHPCRTCCAHQDDALCVYLLQYCDARGKTVFVRSNHAD